MKAKAVIGLGFGDEGKGLVTSYLCSTSKKPLVVRFNGGHQAGHTVTEDFVHTFSNFGSGSLDGHPTYWSRFCTVEPEGLLREFAILDKKGVTPVLYIDKECPITTPYDILHNRVLHSFDKISTVGVGFGATLEREENFFSLKARDLMYPTVLKLKLKLIEEKYYKLMPNETVKISKFLNACNAILKIGSIKIVNNIDEIPDIYSYNLIFEGAQGTLLDQHYGFFPYVTRSNTTSKNIFELLEKDFNDIWSFTDIYYVTRSYLTKHSNLKLRMSSSNKYKYEMEHNRNNKHQGSFTTGVLKKDLFEYAIECNFQEIYGKIINKNLVITHCDVFNLSRKFSRYFGEMDYVFKSYGPNKKDIKQVYVP
jgi:adenylosuccinate synthase